MRILRPLRHLLLMPPVVIFLLVGCRSTTRVVRIDPTTPTAVSHQATAVTITLPTATAPLTATPLPVFTDTPLSPTDTPEPTPNPTLPPLPADLSTLYECINWPQPGLLFHDPLESPPLTASYLVVDPYGGQACRLVLSPYPRGEIASAAGTIFYAVYDEEQSDLTIWRRIQGEMAEPLSFTRTSFDGFTPLGMAISDDGQHLAWSRVTPAADSNSARLEMWSAGVDAGEVTTLVDQQLDLEQDGMRYLEPIRFSADNQYLYYAWSPIGLGGAWSSFSGRYDNLLRVALSGGEPEMIFDCRDVDLFLCLGDFFEETGRLAYVNDLAHQIVVADWSGQIVAAIEPPGRDYVGYPLFSPTGDLAFISADLVELDPQPGIISLAMPPYTDLARELLRRDGVSILWQWLDGTYLLFEYRPERNFGTGLVSTNGQVIGTWPPPNYLEGVLR